ncbi:MAG: glycoside hydrolase family 78 protein [Chloroherpetonaceae bacterium]|nr:glycoside hydrolase family 78 protein [Chthonomonadaceae bacterium]MDW8208605.1 glycoside hydrolase family 78 protein [Chloroherpetonaceae bacterium]
MKRSLFALLLILPLEVQAVVRPVSPSCEYRVNPIGIDHLPPRLSWKLESRERAQIQTAYRIIAAATEADLRAERALLWDTGKVASNNTLHIPYAGQPLSSGQRVWWKVRVWDGQDRPSAWSAPAFFEMGLLREADWKGAQWIARSQEPAAGPAPLFRRTFPVRARPARARVYLCGLGYYELYINGRKVGDQVLDPGYTRYDRRVLYVTHDVTRLLQTGNNAIGVLLGNGFYNVHQQNAWDFDRAPWRASPRLRLLLTITDENGTTQTLISDTAWKTDDSPITYNGIYGGETYDARREQTGWNTPEFNDASWDNARIVEAPAGILSAQNHPPIRVAQTLRPVRLTEPRPGVFVFDIGQNLAGWARITAQGPAGTTITLRYGERLKPDGTLDQESIGAYVDQNKPDRRFQTDVFILKGHGHETFEPRFVYHGFQYVEVTGFPGRPTLDTLSARFVHSDIPQIGQFSCSNPLLNKIWQAGKWAFLSNLQGIPTDCPHREKNGWTGDAHLAAEQALLHFAPMPVYVKWIQDLVDEQRPSGELPGIVPTGGWGYHWGNGPAWDSALLLIPYYLYLYAGDPAPLTRHYSALKRYVDYLTTRAEGGIVSIGLGDWAPYETETPVAVTSTAYYYVDARIVAQAARLLGNTEDAQRYEQLAENIKKAFNERFYNNQTGLYANGSQTALACALYQGLTTPENRVVVLRHLIDAIQKRNYHIDTGILGARYLLHALRDHGHAEIAYRIAAQKDLPSWGYWIEQGATTLWEQWRGTDSRNHIMFGDILAWFTQTLAGIRPDPAAPGFARFLIKPHILGDLTAASATCDSVRGRILSDWKLQNGDFVLNVQVPPNTTAIVHVPLGEALTVTESGNPIAQAAGVRFLERQEDYAVYEVLSGNYRFLSRGVATRRAQP